MFIRGIDTADPNGVDAMLFPDGGLDDVVLESSTPASAAVTTLCPASEVAVVGRRGGVPAARVGDGHRRVPGRLAERRRRRRRQVVQLWPGTGAVQNLGQAATAVALTATHVAAIVTRRARATADLNGDGDRPTAVVAVRSREGGAWTNVGQAADELHACGSVFAFLTPEAAEHARL